MPNRHPARASVRAGTFVTAISGRVGYATFVPSPLPPSPPLEISPHLQSSLDRANQALGRLDGVTLLLPDPDQFLYTYIRKEAVLSSQIEGTQSSLSDLLLFENDASPGVPEADAHETLNYIDAMNHGLGRMERGELPLSLRLLREVHARLLAGTRGADKAPGEFRSTQNWIGGSRPGNARYVPPAPHEVLPAMGALELFLHDDPVETPILIKAALAHAQFETIHPFLDGNGRVGRLLITLLLCSQGVLSKPLLYLSLYLKRNRDTYYEYLQRIRTDGAWEEWLEFFLDGVIEVADSATDTTKRIIQMVERDRQKLTNLGRGSSTALRIHEFVVRYVVLGIPRTATLLNLSEPTISNGVHRLQDAGILREATGRRRGRLYVYDEYLQLLNEGTTEPMS